MPIDNYSTVPVVTGYPDVEMMAVGVNYTASDPTLGEYKWTVKDFGVYVACHGNLLRDQVYDLPAIIEQSAMRAIHVKVLEQVLLGYGTGNNLQGIKGHTGVSVLDAANSTFGTYDILVDALVRPLATTTADLRAGTEQFCLGTVEVN